MRILIAALFLLLPLSSFGQDYQFDPDEVQAFIDEDKNCSDFQNSMLNAQSHYEALQIILNDDDADPHGLDRDGNGYACESLEYNRVLNYPDTSGNLSNGFRIRTQEVVHSVKCSAIAVDYWMNLREWSEKMRNSPLQQIDYLMSMKEAECVDTIYEIYSEKQPSK